MNYDMYNKAAALNFCPSLSLSLSPKNQNKNSLNTNHLHLYPDPDPAHPESYIAHSTSYQPILLFIYVYVYVYLLSHLRMHQLYFARCILDEFRARCLEFELWCISISFYFNVFGFVLLQEKRGREEERERENNPPLQTGIF